MSDQHDGAVQGDMMGGELHSNTWQGMRLAGSRVGALLYGVSPQNRETMVPGSGYVPPVGPAPTPPNQPPQRTPAENARGLRSRVAYNSVDWWRSQALQGALICGVLFAPGLIMVGVSQTDPDRIWLLIPGLMLMAFGLVILGIYLLAPLTRKWIITVPQNQYWAVEDYRGTRTLGFLGEGTLEMQRKTNVRIVPYVTFTNLNVTEVVSNVFDTNDLPVDIEVVALMHFDPTRADPHEYGTLRTMIQPRQFEVVIRQQINLVVRSYLGRIDQARGRSMQDTMQRLEAAIAEHLGYLDGLGLQLATARPVSAFARTPRNIPDHIRRMYAMGGRNSQESEFVRDIRDMMSAFGLSFEEAVRHYYLIKHGVQPPPTASRPAGNGPAPEPTMPHTGAAPDPTMYHTGADPAQFSLHPPGGDETVYHRGAGTGSGAGTNGAGTSARPEDTTRRTIRHEDDVPDPFDLRDR